MSERYVRQLLRHAYEHVPYYRSLDLPDRPLSEYPLLKKAQLRHDPECFHRTDLTDHGWRTIWTSGSTGISLKLIEDQNTAAWFEATETWYLRELLGTPRWRAVSGSKIRIWHRIEGPQAWKQKAQFFAPRKWLDPGSALTEKSLMEYARTINRAKPAYVWSYPGVLYEIAKAAMNSGLRLCKPRFIISSGETLHSFMRPVIEEAFRCSVYDLYGSTEAGYVAGECQAGSLHVFSFSSKVEVLDSAGRPVLPGEEGRLVLTPLHNYAMPLIRYDSDDMAQVGLSDCSCGCQLPTLSRISGRACEFFVTSSGALIMGATLYLVVRRCKWVLTFQILQYDVDQITVFFVRKADSVISREDVETTNAQIADVMGLECTIEWQEVEEIPCTPNGKRPLVRSLVWEARQPVDIWETT